VRYEKWKKHRRELVEDFNKSIDKI